MKSKRPEIEIIYDDKELPNERELFVLGWKILIEGQPDIKQEVA